MSVEYRVFDDGASSTGIALTVALGALAVAAAANSFLAIVVGGAGVVMMAVGVRRPTRRILTLGEVVLFASVLLAGASGALTPLVVFGAAAAVVAWDVGTNAITIGGHLGANAETRAIELVHAGASLVFAVVVGAVASGVYRFANAGQPAMASALLLLAALSFALVLDR